MQNLLPIFVIWLEMNTFYIHKISSKRQFETKGVNRIRLFGYFSFQNDILGQCPLSLKICSNSFILVTTSFERNPGFCSNNLSMLTDPLLRGYQIRVHKSKTNKTKNLSTNFLPNQMITAWSPSNPHNFK